MSWTTLLKNEAMYNYAVAEKIMDLVEDSELEWKPATGNNWMTVGQLLMHITNACGLSIKGFITGDWGLPEGVDINNMPPEDMLPTAEKMPTVKSVAEAKELLAADKKLTMDLLAQTSEDDLVNKTAPAPWDPTAMILGHRLLQMVCHLNQHKGQLYYYQKLMGKPMHTGHLYGM